MITSKILYELALKLRASHMRGEGQNQLKISAPHPMTETYWLIPLSAALILLDSPFKCLTFPQWSHDGYVLGRNWAEFCRLFIIVAPGLFHLTWTCYQYLSFIPSWCAAALYVHKYSTWWLAAPGPPLGWLIQQPVLLGRMHRLVYLLWNNPQSPLFQIKLGNNYKNKNQRMC